MTKVILLLCVFAFLSFTSSRAYGQALDEVGNGSVMLNINTDKKCYDPQQQISVFVTFKNVDSVPIHFYRQDGNGYPTGLEILIYDSKGKLVGERNPKGGKLWLSPSLIDFTRLEPSETFKIEITFRLSSRRVNQYGVFYLRGYYQSPVSNRNLPDEIKPGKVLTIKDDDIYSSKLRVHSKRSCKE